MPRREWGSIPSVERGLVCIHCQCDEWREYTVKGRTRWRCMGCKRRVQLRHLDQVRPPLSLWRSARQRARKHGTPFHITVIDVERVWPADNRCPVFGTEFRRESRGDRGTAPSLDRINPARGYEPDNIAVISSRANALKSDATAEELEDVARWIKSVA